MSEIIANPQGLALFYAIIFNSFILYLKYFRCKTALTRAFAMNCQNVNKKMYYYTVTYKFNTIINNTLTGNANFSAMNLQYEKSLLNSHSKF
ncbi:hypothetical protein Q765_14880 [Flavobacterium rivuli WB 3.3-2 = DSM 21788]|uniref:Uncharacterized protein n=1 Tax=Flavobacterium rivuli WB 3.3-2 = DSM 21788 TaxID=1121895 RepID=A0A0A2MBR4_9FLAO|nr:hypothetical protein Q765_14880 [Flavobacterium rivuli WB 3.3-2 = DSM 21788]